MGAVDEKVCEERVKVVTKMESKVDDHDTRIVDIEKLMEKVITLLGAIETRIEQTEKAQDEQMNKPSFWETDNGKLLFKVLVASGAVLLFVGVGVNVLDFVSKIPS